MEETTMLSKHLRRMAGCHNNSTSTWLPTWLPSPRMGQHLLVTEVAPLTWCCAILWSFHSQKEEEQSRRGGGRRYSNHQCFFLPCFHSLPHFLFHSRKRGEVTACMWKAPPICYLRQWLQSTYGWVGPACHC